MSARSKASPHVKDEQFSTSRALVPAVTKLDEQRVEEGFWPKVRKVAGKIPFLPDVLAGIGFTDDAAVIAAVIGVAGKYLKPKHRDAADAFIKGELKPSSAHAR